MGYKRIGLAAAALFVIASFVFFSANGPGTAQAEKDEVWITIDAGELEMLRKSAAESGRYFEVRKIAENDGIATAIVNEGDIFTISAEMHKHFHKCAGFIAHSSREEAFRSMNSAFERRPESLVTYTIDNPSAVTAMISQPVEPNVRQTIIDLSSYDTRRHDQPTAQQSANYIKNKWETLAAGRSDIDVQLYDHGAVTPQPSVVLTIQGTTFPDEKVILGGHQDSINRNGSMLAAPGADDNASGIASLTEVIRVLAASDFRPERTVQFMAYAAEEVGLKGSRDIAQDYLDANENVIGVLQLDMTNYTSEPNEDIALITDWTNATQNQFLKDLVTAYLPTFTVVEDTCGYACSDHASWHERNYVASFPHEAAFGHNNVPNIHTVNDTISLSSDNANHALKFTKLSLAYVVELAKGSIASTVSAPADFDGDGKTDAGIFRPTPGEWWYLRSGDQTVGAYGFGTDTDVPLAYDFTGDGSADAAFFRPTTGEWYVLRSEDFTFFAFPFGTNGDLPAPGDYDGDGVADAGVYRQSSGQWFILRSADSGVTALPFGVAEDKPVVADYDGDGSDDIAVFRPSVREWWILNSGGGVSAFQFGDAGDVTVPGDYTGDGKADVAFFRPSSGEWFVLRSEDSSYFAFPWGNSGDTPVPGDYDGDGITDAAVWRGSENGTWYIQGSTSGFQAIPFGAAGDMPLPGLSASQ